MKNTKKFRAVIMATIIGFFTFFPVSSQAKTGNIKKERQPLEHKKRLQGTQAPVVRQAPKSRSIIRARKSKEKVRECQSVDCKGLFINNKVRRSVAEKYTTYKRFVNNKNIALVSNKNNKDGLLNSKGKVIYPFVYDRLAYVSNQNSHRFIKKFHIFRKQAFTSESNYIPKNAPSYRFIKFYQNKKYGLTTFKNKRILPAEYDDIGFISTLHMILTKDNKHAIFDPKSKKIITPFYQNFYIDYQRKIILVKEAKKMMFLDLAGKPLTKFNITDIHVHSNDNLIKVTVDDKYKGYFESGRGYFIEPKYKFIEPLNEDGIYLARLHYDFFKKGESKWSFLDKKGNTTHKFDQLSSIKYVGYSCYIVRNNDHEYALMDNKGRFVTPFLYDSIVEHTHGKSLKVTVKKDTFLIDLEGNRLN